MLIRRCSVCIDIAGVAWAEDPQFLTQRTRLWIAWADRERRVLGPSGSALMLKSGMQNKTAPVLSLVITKTKQATTWFRQFRPVLGKHKGSRSIFASTSWARYPGSILARANGAFGHRVGSRACRDSCCTQHGPPAGWRGL